MERTDGRWDRMKEQGRKGKSKPASITVQSLSLSVSLELPRVGELA